MADGQEQFAKEEPVGITADDLVKVKSRAEAAEAVAQAERQGREKAEQERDALTKERDSAYQRIQEEVSRRVQADEVAITNAISSAQSVRDAAAKDLADALAANDATAIAKAIDQQSTAKFEMLRAEDQNRALQNWKAQQVQRLAAQEEARKQQTEQRQTQQRTEDRQQERQPQPQQSDKWDISGFPPQHQEWLKSHPELLENNPKGHRERSMVIADHWDAIGRGIVEGTPSYYEFIEGAFVARKPNGKQQTNGAQHDDQQEDDSALVDGAMEIDLEKPQDSGRRIVKPEAPIRAAGSREHEFAPRQQQTSSAALPPSRSQTPANGNRDAGRVTLSLGEQEAARISFPHLMKGGDPSEAYKEYARNKVALKSEGRL